MNIALGQQIISKQKSNELKKKQHVFPNQQKFYFISYNLLQNDISAKI